MSEIQKENPTRSTYYPVYYVRETLPSRDDSPIGRPSVAILVGQGNRPWLEARGLNGRPTPIGRIRSVVPRSTDYDAALLEALIALWPDHFRSCPSLAAVERTLGRAEILDFDLGADRIPAEWMALREEARERYNALTILRVEGEVAALEGFLVRPGSQLPL